MPGADINGLEIYFETHGDPNDTPLLLVMGFTAQLTSWPDGFVASLVDTGFHVIRFDNRDAGLSSKSAGDPPDLLTVMAAVEREDPAGVPATYDLSDMAADAVGLLDHLGIEAAHVVGASMGGMIVQQLAIDQPQRVLSATSIMSTTGSPRVGQADPAVLAAMLTPTPLAFEDAVAHSLEVGRMISGPLWQKDEAEARTRLSLDRSFNPTGAGFQLAAMAASGDRTERLAAVDVPFLVIHGIEDTLIAPSGGEATAAAVPGADLLLLAAMGHDLPEALWPQLVGAISGIANRPAVALPTKLSL